MMNGERSVVGASVRRSAFVFIVLPIRLFLCSSFIIQHSAFSIQHSSFSIQHCLPHAFLPNPVPRPTKEAAVATAASRALAAAASGFADGGARAAGGGYAR